MESVQRISFLSRSLHFRRLFIFSFRFRAKIDSVNDSFSDSSENKKFVGQSRLAVEDERAQVELAHGEVSAAAHVAPSRLRLWAPANASNCSRRCDRRVLSLTSGLRRGSVSTHTLSGTARRTADCSPPHSGGRRPSTPLSPDPHTVRRPPQAPLLDKPPPLSPSRSPSGRRFDAKLEALRAACGGRVLLSALAL